MELKDFKKEYLELSKKYKLPEFKELNENFEIDKIDKETDCILRLIRKAMIEKIVNSLGFLEMLLNPANSPRIYMPYLKNMTQEDKDIIERIYSALADLSIGSLLLEVEYSEKGEAELIKSIYSTWDSNKADFKKIIINVRNPKTIVRKEKSYFG